VVLSCDCQPEQACKSNTKFVLSGTWLMLMLC